MSSHRLAPLTLLVPLLAAGCGPVALTPLVAERGVCRTLLTRPLADAGSGTGASGDLGFRGAAMPPGTLPAPVATHDPAVRWYVPEEETERSRLDPWCAAVGPALMAPHPAEGVAPVPLAAGRRPAVAGPQAEDAAAEPLPVVDSLVVVSWNLHIGAAAVERLVEDLRAGRLTGGTPVRHFALLLQEAYREGDEMPELSAAARAAGAAEAEPHGRNRVTISEMARSLGLAYFYVPSMRSGAAPEDRGNAVLATLPLHDPVAIELPVKKQRRVVASAAVRAVNRAGQEWTLRLSSVHLDNAAGGLNPERARLDQAAFFLRAVPKTEAAVAGGDFNTWRRGPEEIVVPLMEEAYPDTPEFPVGPTYLRGAGVVRKYLDYMFFRLPDGGKASYVRAADAYGSDHFPLVAVVRPTALDD